MPKHRVDGKMMLLYMYIMRIEKVEDRVQPGTLRLWLFSYMERKEMGDYCRCQIVAISKYVRGEVEIEERRHGQTVKTYACA